MKDYLNSNKIHILQRDKVSQLVDMAEKDKDIKRLIIFGSSVSDRCHFGSDIDFYVDMGTKHKFINKYLDFVYDYWNNFTVDRQMLENEILKKGVVVYERNAS